MKVQGWGLAPLLVVSAILLLYVVLGAVMDELSMLLLTVPIFFPMIMGLDFGMSKELTAIWFGIMVLMTVGFGMLAPPVGLNVYVVNGMAKDVPIGESYLVVGEVDGIGSPRSVFGAAYLTLRAGPGDNAAMLTANIAPPKQLQLPTPEMRKQVFVAYSGAAPAA